MSGTDSSQGARRSAPEPQIAAEIEALKQQHRDTRQLYREVCGLLFFRYGITPTANMLYQHVRKGSMATPAQVLARFWTDLRERSRVRIEHPDLPEALRESAGELVLELWGRAQEAAARNYELQAEESAAAVRAADARAEQAEEDSRLLEARLIAMGAELTDARSQAMDLGRQLATIQGRLASMTEMLRDQSDEMRDLRSELAVSRRDVARAVGETNALRVQLALARHRGARKPLGGVPQDPDPGQEDLALEPELPPDPSAESNGEADPGSETAFAVAQRPELGPDPEPGAESGREREPEPEPDPEPSVEPGPGPDGTAAPARRRNRQ